MAPDDLIIKMECLKLACAIAVPAEDKKDTVERAESFAAFVKGPAPSIITSRLVTN